MMDTGRKTSGSRAAPPVPRCLPGEDSPVARLVRNFRRVGARFSRAGSNLLFPPRCACCDADLPSSRDGLLLCADCRLLLGPESWPCCSACGAAGQPEGDCSWCRKAPLKFDTVITLGGYHEGPNRVVQRMKRHAHDALSMAMGQLLAERRGRELGQFRCNWGPTVQRLWPAAWGDTWVFLSAGGCWCDVVTPCLKRA